MSTDDNSLTQQINRWATAHPYLAFVIGAVAIVFISVGLASAGPDSPVSGACEAELGGGWNTAGYVDIPGADHYHVKCEQAGLFASDEQWITVPRTGGRTDER